MLNYDEWLALNDDERDAVHRGQWNVYEREGYLIPITAAVRLASQCGLPVIDIAIGTFHGGEYVLHLTVPDEHIPNLPAMLEQQFEGFRVAWLPA